MHDSPADAKEIVIRFDIVRPTGALTDVGDRHVSKIGHVKPGDVLIGEGIAGRGCHSSTRVGIASAAEGRGICKVGRGPEQASGIGVERAGAKDRERDDALDESGDGVSMARAGAIGCENEVKRHGHLSKRMENQRVN